MIMCLCVGLGRSRAELRERLFASFKAFSEVKIKCQDPLPFSICSVQLLH